MKYLYVPPESFKRSPMVGVQRECTWSEFVDRFRKPRHGDRKDQFGAWCAGEFKDGIKREDHLLRCYALVFDIDGRGVLDTFRPIRTRAHKSCLIHETFSSTATNLRARVIFPLLEPCTPIQYRAAHAFLRERFAHAGVETDPACIDPGRLSFVPVRRDTMSYFFESFEGSALNAVAIATKHPPEVRTVEPYRPPRDATKVQRAVLEREADGVRATGAGDRHRRMLEACLRVFRPQLQIEYQDGERALLPAFLAATDGKRKGEALRILRDAWRKNGR